MAYGELYIPPEIQKRNAVTGNFLPGHVPHNKGKKWSEYASKRAQKRMAKGWKNLDLHRPKVHIDNSGRCRKEVIAVDDEGHWWHFNYLGSAAQWVGGNRENVGRCCRFNQERYVNLKTGKINTDHKYMGIRFYFETDTVWCEKIKE